MESRCDHAECEGAATDTADIAIVGGGAAGLATAIFAARLMPTRSVLVLDGADKLGAKILVSGGGRCNVTNRVVTVADFCGGSPNVMRRVLAAFPVTRTLAFFREIGVELHEEEDGKLFPDTNQARTMLDALLGEAARLGVRILLEHRVADIQRCVEGFHLVAGATALSAGNVVLATGGQSLPRTGSDGSGYGLAEGLGHTLVPPTPALVPLILDGDFHTPLSGISHEVELTVRAPGWRPVSVRGTLLWTHFGVSGPAVLDVSRHWHRARLEGGEVAVSVNFVPGEDVPAVEGRLLAFASAQPRLQLHNCLARLLPARVAEAVLGALGVDGTIPMAHVRKDVRRKLVQTLVSWPLPVRDSRGYAHAEVTAGGVALTKVDPRSLGSRKCPGLYFAGEILDVDGRIGGFNFQWAWASAWVVATAMARRIEDNEPTSD
jgi:predicted Rossmann fold flavoprotein